MLPHHDQHAGHRHADHQDGIKSHHRKSLTNRMPAIRNSNCHLKVSYPKLQVQGDLTCHQTCTAQPQLVLSENWGLMTSTPATSVRITRVGCRPSLYRSPERCAPGAPAVARARSPAPAVQTPSTRNADCIPQLQTIRKRFSHLWCEMTKKQTIRNAFLNCTLVCPPIRSHHHKFLARRPFWAGASPLPGARHGGAPPAESTLLQEAYLNLRLSENG